MPNSAEPEQKQVPDAVGLRGQMGTFSLVLTVLAMAAPLGAVSGVIPIIIAVGTGAAAPLTFVFVGAVLLLFAVGFTALARHVPTAGAFYAFISTGLGRPPGLGGAFVALLGYLAQLLGAYAFFGLSVNVFLELQFGVSGLPWWLIAAAGWALITALGHFNIELSGRVLSLLMILEVAIVLLFNIPVLLQGGPEGYSLDAFDPTAFTSGSMGLGVLFAVSTFLGFEATTLYRQEARDAHRTIPRATYLAVILIALFYILTSWCLVVAFGSSEVVQIAGSDPSTLFSSALGHYVGPVAQQAMSVLLITSVFASMLSSHNAISRYTFSLGRDQVLPARLGRPHPKHGSPANASALTSAVALILAVPFIIAQIDVASFFSWMFGIAANAVVILMTFACVAVIVYFRRNRTNESRWHTLVAPSLGLVGLLLTLIVVAQNFTLLIGGSEPLAALFLGLTWAAGIVGAILALTWKRTRPNLYAGIGGPQQPEPELLDGATQR